MIPILKSKCREKPTQNINTSEKLLNNLYELNKLCGHKYNRLKGLRLLTLELIH